MFAAKPEVPQRHNTAARLKTALQFGRAKEAPPPLLVDATTRMLLRDINERSRCGVYVQAHRRFPGRLGWYPTNITDRVTCAIPINARTSVTPATSCRLLRKHLERPDTNCGDQRRAQRRFHNASPLDLPPQPQLVSATGFNPSTETRLAILDNRSVTNDSGKAAR